MYQFEHFLSPFKTVSFRQELDSFPVEVLEERLKNRAPFQKLVKWVKESNSNRSALLRWCSDNMDQGAGCIPAPNQPEIFVSCLALSIRPNQEYRIYPTRPERYPKVNDIAKRLSGMR